MSGTAVNGSGSPLTMEPDAVEIAPTKDDLSGWVCEPCGTFNSLTMKECAGCGEAKPEVDPGDSGGADDFDTDSLSVDDINAGLQNLSGGVASAQDIENAARAEEGLPPLEKAGLLDFGPFNPDNALKAIFEKEADVARLKTIADRKKADAKDANDDYKRGSEELLRLIESFKNRRLQALNPSQPYLKDVSGDARPSVSTSRCPWEREHPGQSCPICTAATAKDIVPALESEVHPEHEGHVAVAEAARLLNVLTPLVLELSKINIFVQPEDLAVLSTEDLESLQAYVEEPSPIPPQILVKTCTAAEPGSLIQVCQRCERVLVELTGGVEPYPVDARVGFACEAGTLPENVEALTEERHQEKHGDAPRRPRSHARRNPKRRVEPEQERAKQVASGRAKTEKPTRRKHDKPKAAKKRKR